MKNYIPPISDRPRDYRVAELIRRGYSTDDELFAAQYDEWPVRGLNKDLPRNGIVHFHEFKDDKASSTFRRIGHYISAYAYVREDETERRIYANHFLLGPFAPLIGIGATPLAAARLHDLFDLAEPEFRIPGIALLLVSLAFSSYRYAVLSSFVKLVTPSVADEIGQEHIHVMDKDSMGHLRQAAFQASANDVLRSGDPLSNLATSALRSIDMLLSWMPRDYYASDHEVQARLHNLMVQGYPAWGKIPETSEELYAALWDMGIKAPEFIKKQIGRETEENSTLRDAFIRNGRHMLGYIAPTSAEINIGLNSFQSNQVLAEFWEQQFPMLYADLLVKYGDSRAMERFGFGGESDILGLPTRSELTRAVAAPVPGKGVN